LGTSETLFNTAAEVKAFGIAKSLFILDRGLYCENNIGELSSERSSIEEIFMELAKIRAVRSEREMEAD
jgi:hypothetical protein